MDLDDIAAGGGEAREQLPQYRAALEAAVAAGDAAQCKRFVDHGAWAMASRLPCTAGARPSRSHPTLPRHAAALPPAVLSDAVPLVVSRQLLLAFAEALPKLQPDVQQEVAA